MLTFLKKAYAFLKHFWWIPLLILALVLLWLLRRPMTASLAQTISKQAEAYRKELDRLNARQRTDEKALVKSFMDRMDEIEAAAKEQETIIKKNNEALRVKLQEMPSEDLAKLFAKTFGISHISREL